MHAVHGNDNAKIVGIEHNLRKGISTAAPLDYRKVNCIVFKLFT